MTELSKILRKIRLENGQILKKMADSLGVTSSYLSAVENGKRPMPKEWLQKLAQEYELSQERVDEIRVAADKLTKTIKLNVANKSDIQRDVALVFARAFENMDDDFALQIKDMLTGGHDQK